MYVIKLDTYEFDIIMDSGECNFIVDADNELSRIRPNDKLTIQGED